MCVHQCDKQQWVKDKYWDCYFKGGSATLVFPGSGGHPLLVQGQSIAPVAGAPAIPPQPVAEQREVEMEMGPAVTIMKPILRFLQLLCENHNLDLQVSFY